MRTGSDWCTLCFADLRPIPVAAAPVETPQELAPAEPTVGQPPPLPAGHAIAAPKPDDAPVRRGKHSRSRAGGDAPTVDIDALAAQMLAELAASQPGPVLGPAAFLFDTGPKRAAVSIGGTLLAILLILVVAMVLGKVF